MKQQSQCSTARACAGKGQFAGWARPGFTLMELLVVIGIIVLLVGILIPVVGRIRTAARNADTQAFITQLSNAIENYHNDFHAYPGPLSNTQVYNTTATVGGSFANALNNAIAQPTVSPPSGFALGAVPFNNGTNSGITMSENLVLGLLGGLKVESPTGNLVYDPSQVGSGPMNLNPANPKRYPAYIEAQNLSWRQDNSVTPAVQTGQYKDDAGSANDTIIPEFVDKYVDPMPILYLRAKVGAVADSATVLGPTNNTIITYDATDTARIGQYDLHQIIGYTNPDSTGNSIGVGRKNITVVGWQPAAKVVHGLSVPNGVLTPNPLASVNKSAQIPLIPRYPYDAYPYFRNQSLSTPAESSTDGNYTGLAAGSRNDVPQQKDGFILISAGPDRIYGTEDDIISFGTIGK